MAAGLFRNRFIIDEEEARKWLAVEPVSEYRDTPNISDSIVTKSMTHQ
jgi:hypothetical protein